MSRQTVRLYLMDAQREDVAGLVINIGGNDVDEAHRLEVTAQAAQSALWETPDREHRVAYGRALLRLAKYTHDRSMHKFAESLIGGAA